MVQIPSLVDEIVRNSGDFQWVPANLVGGSAQGDPPPGSHPVVVCRAAVMDLGLLATRSQITVAADSNPFFQRSTLPYELPAFDEIDDGSFGPAFEAGMAEHRAEVDAIIQNPAPPSLQNTIVALERAGQVLARTSAVFYNLTSTNSTPALREVESTYAPLLTAHFDAIRLDPRLFARIDEIARSVDDSQASEDTVLIRRYHLDFVLAGAGLDTDGRAELGELNQRLSVLSTTFQQNLLQDTEELTVLVDTPAELDGLGADAIAGAADAAAARGHAGRYAITLVLPTGQPLLKALRNREVRRRLFEASINRASAGQYDNSQVLLEITKVRAQRARLLGFASHADAKVADQTVKSTATIDEFLARLVGPAVANANAEAAVLAEFAARDGVELAPWDWAYYTERVRAERYDVDTSALRPYFDLERVLHDGVFAAANRLYGISLRPRTDLVGHHPDARVWEVQQRRRHPHRAVHRRLLRAGGQTRRRLDEQFRRPVLPVRNGAGGDQRAEHSAPGGR